MNKDREIPQMFDIETFGTVMVIFSAFKTREIVSLGPYSYWDFMRRLRYRNISRVIFDDKKAMGLVH